MQAKILNALGWVFSKIGQLIILIIFKPIGWVFKYIVIPPFKWSTRVVFRPMASLYRRSDQVVG